MGIYDSLVKPILFCFSPETAHNLALGAIRLGAVHTKGVSDERLSQSLFGVTFSNPIGLAAGFDKNGVAVEHWDDLGFGFAEVGTVTLLPQSGNPKPRLFRIPEDEALINRMGFNNSGASTLADRLANARPQIPVGINIGRSKLAENAPIDYRESFQLLRAYGDYFVVNVSSPNTPGLRKLQEKGALSEVIEAIEGISARRPIFIKIAPDLSMGQIEDVVDIAVQHSLTGIVATNTTISRAGLTRPHDISGGLSGKPLREPANEIMGFLYETCPKDLVLIGVGGIMNGFDLFERISSGAHLCQVYTGMVYGGPNTVPQMLHELLRQMELHGIKSLNELRGSKLAAAP